MRVGLDIELTVVLCLLHTFSVVGMFSCNIEDCMVNDKDTLHALSNHWNCGIIKCSKRKNCSDEPGADHLTVNSAYGQLVRIRSKRNQTINYVNISINFDDDVQKHDREYKLLLYDDNGQCWEINPRKNPPNPVVLPFLPEGDSYKVAQYSSLDKQCVVLGRINRSKFHHLKAVNRSRIVEFTMPWMGVQSRTEDNNNLNYQLLYSSTCCITCNGSLNRNCPFVNVSTGDIPWPKVNESFSKRVEVLSPGFYCMRIGLPGCLRHTSTIQVDMSDDDDTIPKSVMADGPILPYFLAFIGTSSTVIVCIVFAIRKNYRNLVQRRGVFNEELGADDVAEKELEINETEVSVLLLYPYNNEYFEVMNALSDYFRSLNIRVLNPYFDDEAPENLPAWTIGILTNRDTRIILTETSESVAIAGAWAQPNITFPDVQPQEIFFDNYFMQALNTIHHDHTIVHDYTRLFIIRFDREAGSLYNLVPNSRYFLPENLVSLIRHLLNDWTDQEFIVMDEITLEETNLQNAISDFRALQITKLLH